MRPLDVQQIGEELAVKWEDGTESYVPLATLRRYCPCASCKGEIDVLGNLYKAPETQLSAQALKLKSVRMVGGYALQPVWADGHGTGLYSFDYLKKIASMV